MSMRRVFLAGPDRHNWAFDENIRLTALALAGIAEVAALEECEVVHAMWWRAVTVLPRHLLGGKRVITYTNDDPYLRILGDPEHLAARPLIGMWLARNRREMEEYRTLGMRCAFVPRIIDLDVFRPLGRNATAVRDMRTRWDIPDGRYLIGNFQRDTLLEDLISPKLKKGPDIFAQIVHRLHRRGFPIHVVLAGPRRRWLRRRLEELQVPYTYVGQTPEDGEDDIRANTLPRHELNVLYNLVDLYVVSSRDEGHPAAVTESAAAGCKIISTPVGIAPDLLELACLYRSVEEAASLVIRDIEADVLASAAAVHHARVNERHAIGAVARVLKDLYAGLDGIPPVASEDRPGERLRAQGSRLVRAARRVLGIPRRTGAGIVVSIWNIFYRPPYGGANQFMRALARALEAHGVRVVENAIHGVDVHLLQGDGFNIDRFLRLFRRLPLRVIHRLDGPVHLYRGFDRDKDERIFRINAECATASVVQSVWSLEQTVAMGYRPVNPVLIYNAADPALFYPAPTPRDPGTGRVRLVSSAWSDNPQKGGSVYRHLDESLDWSRFEYTFVGRTSERFRNIRVVPPLPTAELGAELRKHDVYVTASQHDPCSNALIEALTSGLPAVYRRDGGHPELVGFGGVPFVDEHDVVEAVERIAANLDTYGSLVTPPTIREVAAQYLTLIHEVLRGDWTCRAPLDRVTEDAERIR
jgi:glycosyltransferase involved in cell wall biosynthesis